MESKLIQLIYIDHLKYSIRLPFYINSFWNDIRSSFVIRYSYHITACVANIKTSKGQLTVE